MQIRLTVLVPQSGDAAPQPCDLMVTAPTGTVLASIVGALTSAAAGAAAGETGGGDRGDGGETASSLFAGTERLDPQRQLVGEPPLVDGAVLSLHAPSAPPALDAYGSARARLHVVSGPDAGGVHLLHGGRVQLGRSADADVVLDDPDVSRLHCAVTVLDGGEVTVTDLGSTNGTSVDGRSVDERPTLLGPEASLHLGESSLRLVASPLPAAPPELATAPDGEGRLQLGGDGGGPGLRHVTGSAGPWGQGVAIPAQGAVQGATEPVGARRADALVPNQSRASEDEMRTETVPGARLPDAPTVSGTGATVEPAAGEAPRRRSRGIGAWARRLASGGQEPEPSGGLSGVGGTAVGADIDHDRWPDPATVLLTALGPGHRLWERHAGHPDSLSVRIGTTHHTDRRGDPLIVDLTSAGGLGLAGPRPRLASLARSLLAQLAVLHAPDVLEIVLIAADPAREAAARVEEWSWLGWLPHLRPRHGQDCRLLTAFDPGQAAARAAELARRPLRAADNPQDGPPAVPVTVLVVDGDPGTPALRDAVARLAEEGTAAGVHVLCLAETPAASPASPLEATIAAAHAASPAFRACRTLALLSGAVATAVRVVRRGVRGSTVATIDGVSGPWAGRFARALAPLREEERADPATGTAPAAPGAGVVRAVPVALPRTCRLLDELGLARATPAAVSARWPEEPSSSGGEGAASPAPSATIVFGAGRRGSVAADLAEAGHGLVTGPPGSGKTELLHGLAASLAAGERPERLRLELVEGATPATGNGRDGSLRACADLPHVTGRLSADDPVRMREYAQALVAELKRRAALAGPAGFDTAGQVGAGAAVGVPGQRGGDEVPPGGQLPRLVVLVDDFDALVDPPLGSPGRPAAGSVVRALEAVARDGARLGVHLLASAARPDRAAHTETVGGAGVRAELTGREGRDEVPGRGVVRYADGTASEVQAGRVRGRIPRTATIRPTVVPLDWARAGDPPTRRPVRELGNGPTDLALLASAMERAARPTTPAPRPAAQPTPRPGDRARIAGR